ncbi:MAG: HAD-IIA family hydrolase [Candidatus Limnocylindrales bacterium]
MPHHAMPPARERAALAAVLARSRALLIDVDGVLVQAERPIPGAAAALATLARRGLPYRLATNTSLVSRATLARQASALGLAIDPGAIVSALSVTAETTARRFPGQPLYVLCSDDARTEFAGQHLLDEATAEAAADGAMSGSSQRPAERCAAVVIGDAPASLDYEHLDRAFRLVRSGARLIAMHRNPWWLTPRGPSLDAGAFVVGLEFATRRRAIVAGKPAAVFFAAALRALGHAAPDVAMIGDDVRTDVAGARRAGMMAVWVRSGRHGSADLALHAAGGGRTPDAVADDLAAIVAALPEA